MVLLCEGICHTVNAEPFGASFTWLFSLPLISAGKAIPATVTIPQARNCLRVKLLCLFIRIVSSGLTEAESGAAFRTEVEGETVCGRHAAPGLDKVIRVGSDIQRVRQDLRLPGTRTQE